MNKFLRALASFCDKHKFDSKIHVAPSLRVGHQWVETLTRNESSIINLQVQTFKGFVFNIANPILTSNGLRSVSDTGALLIISRLLGRLIESGESYFSTIPARDTLSKSLSQTIQTLRIYGIGPHDINPSAFESPEKAHDLAWLLTEYIGHLRTGKLVDYADVLTMVAQQKHFASISFPTEYFVLALEDIDWAPLEIRLAGLIGEGRFISLPVDSPVATLQTNENSDARLLSWILDLVNAPGPKFDGSAKIFHAVGHSNEVREAVRRVMFPTDVSQTNPKYHLDEVELLYTDQRVYIPIIFDLFSYSSMFVEIPTPFDLVTFADGVPARLSKPGRCLIAWLTWIRDDYPQMGLIKMIQDGLLDSKSLTEDSSFTRMASALRSIPIGHGRDNYQIAIERKIQEMEQTSNDQQRRASEECEETNDHRDSGEDCSGAIYMELLELINGMLQTSCPVDRATTLQSALIFLDNFVRSSNEFDNYSKLALKSRIQELLDWITLEDDDVGLDIYDWLLSLPDEARVMGSGPQPGKIHVANLLSGGHSARRHTIILGLDDTRFPGFSFQDPAFLDHEKERISAGLALTSNTPKMNMIKLAKLFARLEGDVTLGFTSHDLLTDRSLFPSSAIFSAFRILSNQRDADQQAMFKWLVAPASAAPSLPETSICDIEWWMSALCTGNYINGADIVLQHFPNLAAGAIGCKKRFSDVFTEHDGYIEKFSEEIDPTVSKGKVLSASALETLGTCPLKYFFRYVLGLKPQDEVGLDPSRWLDAIQFGNLAHEVFYTFLSELIDEQRKIEFESDLPRLLKILNICLERYQSLVPILSDSALRRQVMELEAAMRVFLIEEETLRDTWRPVVLEASVGLPADPNISSSKTEPVSIRLPNGRSLRAKGKIDRIDQCELGSKNIFRIVDYKMGSSRKFENDKNFKRGSIVQHVIYRILAETYLGREKLFSPAIDDFVYFFPSVKNRGLRVHRLPNDDSDLEIISNLCRLMTNAAFIATNDSKDCDYCDYLTICDDPKTLTEISMSKLQNPDNKSLEPIRKLRRI